MNPVHSRPLPRASILSARADHWNSASAKIDVRAPLSGTYTVLVAGNTNNQTSTGRYVLTVVGSTLTASPQLILYTFDPVPGAAAALDALLFLRDPFPVVNAANLFNVGSDRNTRVLVFVANLQLAQGETASSVVVNLVDSNNQIFDVVAQDPRPVPNFSFTQVTFRLPDNLPAGTCTIKIKAHGQVSNAGTIRIRI